MGLDYTSSCVNFRDVSDSLELVAGEPLIRQRRLFRGGKINFITDPDKILNPATILNLRRGPDPENLPVIYAHFPASNSVENYETTHRTVRRWLNDIAAYFADPKTQFPVLVHCTSGKDRTGIVIAALQRITGIDRSLIIEEYLFSVGEVRPAWIETALQGIGDPEEYFRRIDLEAIRERLLLYNS